MSNKDHSAAWFNGLAVGVLATITGIFLGTYFSGCSPDVVTITGAKGDSGLQGPTGSSGADGEDGVDATPVTMVQLCPGTPTYPTTFIEYAFCVQGKLYATYSANGGFTTYLPPGNYSSNAINSSCNVVVGDNCQVSN